MARVLTRRRYIKERTTLEKSTKPSTMPFVVSILHIALIQGSTPHRLRIRASGVWPFWPNFRPNFALSQKKVPRYTLNCVEPWLSWLQNRKWPRAFGLVSIVFGD